MAKKVVILNQADGTKFGFGERTVTIGTKMAIADAERISQDYPGVYCKVVDEPAATTTTTETKTIKQA